MTTDLRFMRRALALAKRGKRTFPNPLVGCILVKDGRVIAEGWHDIYGGPHAEAAALKKTGARARGATAYVTLEPCVAHEGKKTPPCADALAEAGVARVVVALRDPNPGVAGKGISLLKRAGIKTSVGLGAREARSVNADFFDRMKLKKPWVILKAALSIDGKTATDNGKSQWITSPASRNEGHRLRAEVDAILVGVGTVLADDPSLTSHGAGRDPVRVILDGRGRIPNNAKVLDGKAPTWIVTSSPRKFRNAQTIRLPSRSRKLDLRAVLAALKIRGIGSILIEGGPKVHSAFLAAGLVDEAYLFLAPKLLNGARDPNKAPRVSVARPRKLGPDFLFRGRIR